MHTTARWTGVLTAAACAVALFTSHAQVTLQWSHYNNASPYRATAVDQSGNVFTAGMYYDGVIRRALLVKYDSAGTVLWSRTFLPGTTDTYGYALAIDGNGAAIMVGRTNSTLGFSVKFDASGQLQWSHSTARIATQVAVDTSNNVYVLTSESNSWTGELVKYSPLGVQQWTANAPAQMYNRAGIAVQGGSAYVTGMAYVNLSSRKSSLSQVAQTIRYNTTNGAQVWVANYEHADKRGQYGVDIAVDASGNVYVLGNVSNTVSKNNPQVDPNYLILKYNTSGVQQWVRIFDGNATDRSCSPPCTGTNGSDASRAIAVDNSGNVIVTGACYTTTGAYTGMDITTVKYNSAGTQQWVRTYDGPPHLDDWVSAVETSASGAVYVTGGSWLSSSEQEAVTIKYSSSGTQEWLARYHFLYREYAHDMALDPGGSVYIAGSLSTDPQNGGGLLIKYTQSGTPKAAARRGTVPEGVALEQNFPNPFNPSTTIRYTLPEESHVRLTVYNALGREVTTLVNEVRSAGTHTAQLNAGGLESGLYTYELTVNGGRVSRTMLLLK